jgi:hypothetical protein
MKKIAVTETVVTTAVIKHIRDNIKVVVASIRTKIRLQHPQKLTAASRQVE